ncbi:MAG: ParA family protein, partial [Chloroflexota bacterium]
KPMKIITLLNEKGGVGKTTLAIHIAAGLAIRGYRVVLADTDMQANATIAFGLRTEGGIYNLLVRSEETPIRDVLRPVNKERLVVPDAVQDVRGQLYVIPSNHESRNIPNSISDQSIVMERFGELDSLVDYIIIDTAPTANLLHTAIYAATDAIIYPTRLEEWSFFGLNQALKRRTQANALRQLYDFKPIEIIGIVPTMAKMRTILHQENLKKLKATFGDMVLNPIASRTVWAEAASNYTPLYGYDPNSSATAEAWGVVDLVEGVKRGTQE